MDTKRFITRSPQIWRNAINCLMDLSHTENVYDITIKPHSESKSDAQRGYYYGVVIPAIKEHMERHYGEIASEAVWDEYLKAKLGQSRLVVVRGEDVYVPFSIAKASVKEMSAYIDKVCMYAATEWNCNVPEAVKYGSG